MSGRIVERMLHAPPFYFDFITMEALDREGAAALQNRPPDNPAVS